MKKQICSVITVIVIFVTVSAVAAPTIIRDKRITDIALTPTLGRGYTIVTNTFQSKCLDDIAVTDPSYDFQYKFESVESTKSTDTSTSMERGANAGYAGISMDLSAKFTFASGKKEFYHHIFVEINMDTYYASVDEAKTKMSASAANLLTSDDIPGFFSSCGSYYVRSLGRNAKFISIFTYTDETDTKDAAFEAALEMSVKAFGVEAGAKSSISQTVSTQASNKKLTITTNAFGLGKNEGATLISYDLESFKAAIKDAFISMQNPMTGKVTTMEVVPWVENTEFQSLVKLEKEVPDPDKGGKPMLLYKKKHILNQNAEFLAEVERADRNYMNIFYKAKICQQTIRATWYKGDKLHPSAKDLTIVNNKFPNETMLLGELDSLLTDQNVDILLDNEEAFMYGGKVGEKKGSGDKTAGKTGGGDKASAVMCIDKLLESGMFVTSWRQIKECVEIRGKLSAVIGEKVDDYCMPQIAKPVAKSGK